MKKLLVPTALALAVAATGSAFVAPAVGASLYDEAPLFANHATSYTNPTTEISKHSLSLYEETGPAIVPLDRSVDLAEQRASTVAVPGPHQETSSQPAPNRNYGPE